MEPFGNSQNFQNGNGAASPTDGMAWWLKWLIKGAAVFFGFMAVILGIVTAISISLKCIIGGAILV